MRLTSFHYKYTIFGLWLRGIAEEVHDLQRLAETPTDRVKRG
ncbi:MAG TPA: hypothetical protein VGS41_03205 [Chthonomonadales bacterium]|nr:hypothetical protein [Chthonomonadales bacterium]